MSVPDNDSTEQQIRPGRVWLDDAGKRIEAHGGSVIRVDGTYYWYGEDKSHTDGKSKIWTWGVRCYSSHDLVTWHDEGYLVDPELNNPASPFFPERRLDRPHIIRRPDGQFVMWCKFSDTGSFTILTAPQILGPYTQVKDGYQPQNRHIGDFDLYVDPSGHGYLFTDADHTDSLAYRLDDAMTGVEGEPVTIYHGLHAPKSREGLCHFVHDGRHYLLTSGMSGYVPNPSEIAVADDPMGEWTVLGDPSVDDPSGATFNSQASCVFDAGNGRLIMMADRWVPDYVMTQAKTDALGRVISAHFDHSIKVGPQDIALLQGAPLGGNADTSKAVYVWLPIDFDSQMPQIRWKDAWKPSQRA